MKDELPENAVEPKEADPAATTEPTTTKTTTETVPSAEADKLADPKDGATPDKADKPDAPDYADLKLPEGVQADERFDEFKALAGKHGINVEAAQDLLGMYAGAASASMTAAEAAWMAEVEGWQDEVAADKEIGGRNTAATKTNVGKAVDKFGDDGLKEILESTKLGDHPSLVRLLNRVGRELAEDQPPRGGARDTANPLAKMYPTMFEGAH